MEFALMACVGLATGFLSASLGIGGGVLMVPALIFAFGMETKAAIATSIGYIVPVATMGLFCHSLAGRVQWRALVWLVPPGH